MSDFIVREAGQHFGCFIAGESSGTGVVQAAEHEVTFGIVALDEVEVAFPHRGSVLEYVVAVDIGERVGELVELLRHVVGTTVTLVVEFGVAVAADQDLASEQRGWIGARNSDRRSQSLSDVRGIIAVGRGEVTEAEFIHDGRAKCAGIANGKALGVVDVVAGSESGGATRSQTVRNCEIVVRVAVTEKHLVLLRSVEVSADIEVVEIADLLALSDVVVLHRAYDVRQRKGLQVLQSHRIWISDHVGSGGTVPAERSATAAGYAAERSGVPDVSVACKGVRGRICAESGKRGQSRAEELAEVSSAHLGGGNSVSFDAVRLILTAPLVIAECKQFVFPDGPTERAAKLALPEYDRSGGIVVMGLTKTAAAEQEGRPMQRIRTRLGARLQDHAAASSVFGGRHAGGNTEFLDRFRRREKDDGVDQRVVVVYSVKNVVVRLWAQTVGGERRATGFRVTEGFRVCSRAAARRLVAIRAASHARREQGELSEVAAVQRELGHFPSLNDFAHVRGSSVDKGHVGCNVNRGGGRARFHLQADLFDLRDFERKIGGRGLEAGELHLNVIFSSAQRVLGVFAGCTGLGGHDSPCPGVGHGDGGVRYDRAGSVCDGSDEAGCIGLRECESGQAEHQDQNQKGFARHVSSNFGDVFEDTHGDVGSLLGRTVNDRTCKF